MVLECLERAGLGPDTSLEGLRLGLPRRAAALGRERPCRGSPNSNTAARRRRALALNCCSFFSNFCCRRRLITASGLEMERVKLVSGNSEKKI